MRIERATQVMRDGVRRGARNVAFEVAERLGMETRTDATSSPRDAHDDHGPDGRLPVAALRAVLDLVPPESPLDALVGAVAPFVPDDVAVRVLGEQSGRTDAVDGRTGDAGRWRRLEDSRGSIVVEATGARAGADDDRMLEVAEALAAAIRLRQRVDAAEARVHHLEVALERQVRIEQAKGVLSVTTGLDPDAAFQALRAHARRSSRRLADVVDDVLAGRVDDDAIRSASGS